jgi:hypothetical protein
MMRLCLLLGIILLASGCASDGAKDQWADFWKDVRGDNMQMRGLNDHSDSTKDR